MDMDSLSRVLMELKGEAKKMRRKELGDRFGRIADDQDKAVDAVKMPNVGTMKPKPNSLEIVIAQGKKNEDMADDVVSGNKSALGGAEPDEDDDENQTNYQRLFKKFNL